MDKIKRKSLKWSMAVTFIVTICIICIISAITIFLSSQEQQKILNHRSVLIKNPDYSVTENGEGYRIDINDIDESSLEWLPLSMQQNVAYYCCYIAMIGLPVLYIVVGIGITTALYYRHKLRIPILQLQNGMKKIQDNDLDFEIEYSSDDELGQLCGSMEKMRKELRQNNKVLWESLEERKLLNASVAHDLRTPATVLKGYLDYLQRNIPQDRVTEEELMDTLASMQGAVLRLESYTECVRNVENMESIEIKPEKQNTTLLLNEMKSNICQYEGNIKICFESSILLSTINIDKSVLFRVVENLLQNALRYAREQVLVDIFLKDDFLIISVKDDGNGFANEDLGKATTMFYGNEKGDEHFGIGLGVCKLLCERHGGFLKIGNNETAGAYVTAAFNIFDDVVEKLSF